ncbi:unnamed protein product [Tilletia controversa]|nr:unnamed protein product [Tilletia controversa]
MSADGGGPSSGDGNTTPAYAKSALYSAIYGTSNANALNSSSGDPTAADAGRPGAGDGNTASASGSSATTAAAGGSAPAWSAALRFAPRARASGSSGSTSSASLARSRSIPTSLAIRSSLPATATALPTSYSTSAVSLAPNATAAAAKPAPAFQPARNLLGMDDDEETETIGQGRPDSSFNAAMPRSRPGSGSLVSTIKMPRPNAPAAKPMARPGMESTSVSLNAAIPPPVSSVHGRPAAQRQPNSVNVTSSAVQSVGGPKPNQDILRRPRPPPSFSPPPMTLTDQEVGEDKELARLAAERRGDFPSGLARGYGDEGEEEEDASGSNNNKRKRKNKRRKQDGPILNMDADYEPRMPNDYAAFRALLRERRQAERDHAPQRAGGEEEWLSDDDDDGDDGGDRREDQRRDYYDEEERRRDEEQRRKMMRFAPPSSYVNPRTASASGSHKDTGPASTVPARSLPPAVSLPVSARPPYERSTDPRSWRLPAAQRHSESSSTQPGLEAVEAQENPPFFPVPHPAALAAAAASRSRPPPPAAPPRDYSRHAFQRGEYYEG